MLRERQAAHTIHICLHSLGINEQLFNHARQPHQREIECDRCIWRQHAFNRGVGDISLMPERYIFHGRRHSSAHNPGKPSQVFGQDGISLMWHGGGAFLPRMEKFFRLQNLSALQMPDLNREPFYAAGDDAQYGEEHRMAITRNDLGRNRLH